VSGHPRHDREPTTDDWITVARRHLRDARADMGRICACRPFDSEAISRARDDVRTWRRIPDAFISDQREGQDAA